MLKPLTFIY